MNDTTIYDLIQSLGDKHNAVEEIISHCTEEYKKMTSATKSGTVSKTQDYAADALVAIATNEGDSIISISQYFVDLAQSQSNKLEKLQRNLASTYNRLNIGKEETGRFNDFFERTTPDLRTKYRDLEGDLTPMKARSFPGFQPNRKIDLNKYSSVGIVVQRGFRDKEDQFNEEVNLSRRTSRATSTAGPPLMLSSRRSLNPSSSSSSSSSRNSIRMKIGSSAPRPLTARIPSGNFESILSNSGGSSRREVVEEEEEDEVVVVTATPMIDLLPPPLPVTLHTDTAPSSITPPPPPPVATTTTASAPGLGSLLAGIKGFDKGKLSATTTSTATVKPASNPIEEMMMLRKKKANKKEETTNMTVAGVVQNPPSIPPLPPGVSVNITSKIPPLPLGPSTGSSSGNTLGAPPALPPPPFSAQGLPPPPPPPNGFSPSIGPPSSGRTISSSGSSAMTPPPPPPPPPIGMSPNAAAPGLGSLLAGIKDFDKRKLSSSVVPKSTTTSREPSKPMNPMDEMKMKLGSMSR